MGRDVKRNLCLLHIFFSVLAGLLRLFHRVPGGLRKAGAGGAPAFRWRSGWAVEVDSRFPGRRSQQATDVNQFLVAVGQTITQVRATNSPARMQAVAKQIIAAGPALVSLQELDQWYTTPFTFAGGCGAPTLEFDFLQELQDALAAQGAHYVLAVKGPQYAFPPIHRSFSGAIRSRGNTLAWCSSLHPLGRCRCRGLGFTWTPALMGRRSGSLARISSRWFQAYVKRKGASCGLVRRALPCR